MAIGYGQRGRAGLPREYFMNFGGWVAHPEEDSDVFGRLPEWRKSEILEARRVSQEFPTSKASIIVDPSTMKPYPGQVLMVSFIKPTLGAPGGKTIAIELESRPSVIDLRLLRMVSFIPDSVPLTSIRAKLEDNTALGDQICHLSSEQLTLVLTTLKKHVTPETVLRNCTAHGGGDYILCVKPTDGVYAYIWRMALLFSGDDSRLPITACWDLSDGIEGLTGLKISFAILDDAGKVICSWLESFADLLAICTGNSSKATLNWGCAPGWNQVRDMEKIAAAMDSTVEELTSAIGQFQALKGISK